MAEDLNREFDVRNGQSSINVAPDESSRQRLYQILSDPTQGHERKIERLLELGCEQLNVENGHIVNIGQQAGRHDIVAAVGSDLVQDGAITELERTFCRKTIETDQILAIHNTTDDDWADDPASQAWDIGCYIGSKLFVQGDLYGTICFVDSDPRDSTFTQAERAFVDLLSQAVSRLVERRTHEQALDAEQERIQLFVREVADYALFMLDPAGYIMTWNTGARRLKQYDADEIIGEHVSRLYTEADRERGLPAQLLAEARQKGRTEDEGWRVRKDGSTFWALVSITALYNDDGELRGFGKVTRDLTDRRAAQQALQEEQAFTEHALNALDDLFIVLSPEGTIQRVNERALNVTGYAEDEILSMEPVDFFAPEDRDAIAEGISEVLETGRASAEATLITKNGERLKYEFRVRRLTDGGGTITGIVGIGRDITERTLYEQRLKVAQRVLRHNLRNDLNVIRGNAELLLEKESDTQQNVAERIVKAVDRLVDLSEKTRAMTKLDPSGAENHPPVEVMERLPAILNEFRAAFPEATIESDLPATESLPLLSGDHFEMAINNAIENALKHNSETNPWVRVVVDQKPGQVHIRVQDNGPGIPENEQTVLTEGGETPLTHGRGIGLWLIHWCMTIVGGQFSVRDRDPQGSELTLTFPIAEES